MTSTVSTTTPAADTPTTTTTSPRVPRNRKRTARRPREFTTFDVWILVGSMISALCLNWLIFYRFTAGASAFGFLLGSYATFLLIFAIVTTDRVGRLVAHRAVVGERGRVGRQHHVDRVVAAEQEHADERPVIARRLRAGGGNRPAVEAADQR